MSPSGLLLGTTNVFLVWDVRSFIPPRFWSVMDRLSNNNNNDRLDATLCAGARACNGISERDQVG